MNIRLIQILPESGEPPKQLMILLHGVGADGNDLFSLAPLYQSVLPGARIVSPNAPEAVVSSTPRGKPPCR